MNVTSINLGMSFRQAAADGDIASMHALYSSYCLNDSPNLNIFESDSSTGKSAAHFAAEKGHAAVLRLLHSIGDSFTRVDAKGFTPAQLARDAECKRVFELVSLGKKALEAADQVFPHKIIVKNCEGMECMSFLNWRRKVTEITSEKVLDATKKLFECLMKEYYEARLKGECLNCQHEIKWIQSQSNLLIHLYDNYNTLDLAIKMGQQAGACGELSTVSYVYLTSMIKTNFSVDQVGVTNGANNHAFVVLNRNQKLDLTNLNGWTQTLLIDPLAGRSFFYENLIVVAQSAIKAALLTSGSLELLASSKKISTPTAWQPNKTIEMLQKIKSTVEGCTGARLSELLVKKS